MLAAVGDADLGKAPAINDAASRVGGVAVIALVPALIGATGGRSIAHALAHGHQLGTKRHTSNGMSLTAVPCAMVTMTRRWAPGRPKPARIGPPDA